MAAAQTTNTLLKAERHLVLHTSSKTSYVAMALVGSYIGIRAGTGVPTHLPVGFLPDVHPMYLQPVSLAPLTAQVVVVDTLELRSSTLMIRTRRPLVPISGEFGATRGGHILR